MPDLFSIRFYFLLSFVLTACFIKARKDSLFKHLSYGKCVSVYSIGGGAIKRYMDSYYFDKDIQRYYKSPSFSLSADYCFYPTASNAYLGIGPFVNAWMARKVYVDGLKEMESNIYNALVSVKLTHHTTYFVTKHLDVFTGYIFGFNIRRYDEQVRDAHIISDINPETLITPAFGISLTVRYYFNKSIGVYGEGGIGYKFNLLNIGLCFKFKRGSS